MGLHIKTPPEQHQGNEMAPITGTYTQVSSEKYEEFLKALGVGFILRKAALASTPVMTISEDGGNWTMVTKTTVKSIELKFRLGEEFEEDNGRAALQDSRHPGGEQDDHHPERHQGWREKCGGGEGVQRRGADLHGHL